MPPINYIPLVWNRKTALFAVLALALFAFYPCLTNGFTNWDDGVYLLDNPLVLSLEPENLLRIFSRLHNGLYKPLVFLSFALEHRFFGFQPLAYHAVNLAFHLGNCVLVFLLAERLRAGIGAAFVTALLFGIHPMHVESVAWISERKDMLYSFFFLLSLLAYARYRDSGSRAAYWCSVGAYALSMLSKPFGIALPALLFLLDWFDGRARDRSFWTDKLPFLVLGAGFSIGAYAGVKSAGVLFAREITLLGKLQLLSYSFLFYLGKAFWPSGLSVIYPYPEAGAYPAAWLLSPLVLLADCAAAFYLCRKNRLAAFGAVFFVLTLAPGLQWLPTAPSMAMDHYSYVPYIGLFLALSAPALGWLSGRSQAWRRGAAAVFGAVVLAFCLQSRARCAVWHDSCSLWSDMIAKYPRPIAYVNRAACLIQRGLYREALPDLQSALALKPDYHLAYSNRSLVFAAYGDKEGALADLRRAAELAPRVGLMHFRLGLFLRDMGREDEALPELEKAATLSPRDYMARIVLGNLYLARNCPEDALAEFQAAQDGGAPASLGVRRSVEGLRGALDSEAPGLVRGDCKKNR